eukprot:CAMPEP_0194522542 /NCGR_PEP_ID=MMETSP0253-20130528/57146_1 /TAXON_ID=2966 /ORGANISM="Noctiluca scintillans" /LENGTH=502 /DNA_ID=CAMNT_0039366989 /DNA_START=57 /DNA_END=1566 /DNA_ORIENTATION=+
MLSALRRDKHAVLVYKYLRNFNGIPAGPPTELSRPPAGCLRLFAWDLSHFSGKVRAYLRYKSRFSSLKFEEIVATPSVVTDVLARATQSTLVPQLQMLDGRIVQDSTEIMDEVEAIFPDPPVTPSVDAPRQRLTCHLLELLGDEWLLAPAFHWRWAYSGDGSRSQLMPHTGGADPPSHRLWNELQWGTFLHPEGAESAKQDAARWLFDEILLTDVGVKLSSRLLGVTWETVAAWEASCKDILSAFEAHLTCHDFVLGALPSTADFGLLGPLYAHLYRDPVPGAMMRIEFPRVANWCERCHNRGGEKTGITTCEELDDWLEDDEVPGTILPILEIFFTEMWPVLKSTCRVLTEYLRSGDHGGGALPSRSLGPDHWDQMGMGPLVHAFSLPFSSKGTEGESRGRRMVIPYQVWMLQRVEATLQACKDRAVLEDFLARLGGSDMLQLGTMLDGCRVSKKGGLVYPDYFVASRPWFPVLAGAAVTLWLEGGSSRLVKAESDVRENF